MKHLFLICTILFFSNAYSQTYQQSVTNNFFNEVNAITPYYTGKPATNVPQNTVNQRAPYQTITIPPQRTTVRVTQYPTINSNFQTQTIDVYRTPSGFNVIAHPPINAAPVVRPFTPMPTIPFNFYKL